MIYAHRTNAGLASNSIAVFRSNPLEVFEIEARLSRYYDHWVRFPA